MCQEVKDRRSSIVLHLSFMPQPSVFIDQHHRIISDFTVQSKCGKCNSGKRKKACEQLDRLDKRLSGYTLHKTSGKMLQIRASEVQGFRSFNISTTSKNVTKISAYDCGNQTHWQLSDFVNHISNLKCSKESTFENCWTQKLS